MSEDGATIVVRRVDWEFAEKRGQWTIVIRCPWCLRGVRLRHSVSKYGAVSPSYSCPYYGRGQCPGGKSRDLHLNGWQHGAFNPPDN